jgi:hypothetical protein
VPDSKLSGMLRLERWTHQYSENSRMTAVISKGRPNDVRISQALFNSSMVISLGSNGFEIKGAFCNFERLVELYEIIARLFDLIDGIFDVTPSVTVNSSRSKSSLEKKRRRCFAVIQTAYEYAMC